MAGEVIVPQWDKMLRWSRQQVLKLREKYPDEPALLSVVTQLDYLIALADGVETDDSALEDITIGYLAVYPLADVLPDDVSVALCEISQMIKQGLRSVGRRSKHE